MPGVVKVGRGPHGIVMVARIGGVDGQERQGAQILAVTERLAGDIFGLFEHIVFEAVRNALGMDGDNREGARCERVAEHFDNAGVLAGWPAAGFGEY